MIPAAREPIRPADRGRLADPADVEFALRALLGPGAQDATARAALAARLPARPTLAQVVEAVYRQQTPRSRRLALQLLDAYFHLDPPVPASGDTLS